MLQRLIFKLKTLSKRGAGSVVGTFSVDVLGFLMPV